ncbi:MULTISPECIES: hypothetical protein [Bradyrhizobium]|uniref:hypothetical protein n=1 Tax=Bradyrhizobium TaxID=374 RepID=UPI001144A320|nr:MULTISPECIES: hypothetical protein [Bradyrhizobium]UFW46389.1 hypothetical protein BaraCB756_29310 [Bradyrhizobium arachidis]
MNPVAGLSSKASRLGATEIGDSSAADAVASVGHPALRARARTDGAERLGRYDLALEIAHHRLASEVVHLVAEVGHQTLIRGKACHANARLAHHHVYQQSDRCWPDAYVSLPTANLPGSAAGFRRNVKCPARTPVKIGGLAIQHRRLRLRADAGNAGVVSASYRPSFCRRDLATSCRDPKLTIG